MFIIQSKYLYALTLMLKSSSRQGSREGRRRAARVVRPVPVPSTGALEARAHGAADINLWRRAARRPARAHGRLICARAGRQTEARLERQRLFRRRRHEHSRPRVQVPTEASTGSCTHELLTPAVQSLVSFCNLPLRDTSMSGSIHSLFAVLLWKGGPMQIQVWESSTCDESARQPTCRENAFVSRYN